VGGGDLEHGSGYFSSISVCFKGDGYKKGSSTFLRKKVHPRKSWLRLWSSGHLCVFRAAFDVGLTRVYSRLEKSKD